MKTLSYLLISLTALMTVVLTSLAGPRKDLTPDSIATISEATLGDVWIQKVTAGDNGRTIDYWCLYATNISGRDQIVYVTIKRGSRGPVELAFEVEASHNTEERAKLLHRFDEPVKIIGESWGTRTPW